MGTGVLGGMINAGSSMGAQICFLLLWSPTLSNQSFVHMLQGSCLGKIKLHAVWLYIPLCKKNLLKGMFLFFVSKMLFFSKIVYSSDISYRTNSESTQNEVQPLLRPHFLISPQVKCH